MDRLQTLAELRHRLAMQLERTVRKESDLQIGDVLKRGTSHLGANLVLAIVRSDKKQLTGRTRTAAEREVQQPHDARVDRRRMLDLERSRHRARGIEPQHVDQPNRLASWALRQRHRQFVETTVAQASVAERPAAVVCRDVHGKVECAAQIAQPRLNFGVRPVRIPIRRSARRLLAHAREVGLP